MREVLDLKARINQLFDDLLARAEAEATASSASGEWCPQVDVYELPDRVVLRADVPGVGPDELEVRIEAGQLVLRGSRSRPGDLDETAVCRVERPFGAFARRYALPETVDPQAVRAVCQNGVLEIVLSKRDPAVARRIPVQAD